MFYNVSGCCDSCLWLHKKKNPFSTPWRSFRGSYFGQVLWVIMEPLCGFRRRKAPVWVLRLLWCYESVWSVVFAFRCTSFILVFIDDRMIDALGVLFYKLWKAKYKIHPFFCLKFTLDPLRPAGRHHNLVNQRFYFSTRNIFVQTFFFNISSLSTSSPMCQPVYSGQKHKVRIHHDTRKN